MEEGDLEDIDENEENDKVSSNKNDKFVLPSP